MNKYKITTTGNPVRRRSASVISLLTSAHTGSNKPCATRGLLRASRPASCCCLQTENPRDGRTDGRTERTRWRKLGVFHRGCSACPAALQSRTLHLSIRVVLFFLSSPSSPRLLSPCRGQIKSEGKIDASGLRGEEREKPRG